MVVGARHVQAVSAIGFTVAMVTKNWMRESSLSANVDRFEAARRVLAEAIAARTFPGCAFGVLAGGQIQLVGGAGRFTYQDEAPAVTAETVYDVASLTKVVATTAAAMLLLERGKMDLETPLGNLLPDFVAGRDEGDPARRLKLRHLLAHNSGLPGYVAFFRTSSTPEALMQACFALALEAEPEMRAEYSDPGFILLGRALEVLAGEDLGKWVSREVFQPLAMGRTGFCPQIADRAGIPPTEIDSTLRHRQIQGEVQDENAWVLGGTAGHAGLFSSVPDLLRFAGEILRSENGDGKAFVQQRTLELFAQRQLPMGSWRALGWDTPSEKSSSGRYFSQRSIGHLGYSGCSLWIDLEKAIAVVLLTNRTWPDRGAEAARLIREVRPAFHDAVVTCL
jgi:CubicO group peptidase (beta-lactamase class C family)